nr:putative amine oxidase copper-containing [Biomphalaria glabrata]
MCCFTSCCDQPPRQARVMMLRGDLTPAVVQEFICGPLPNVQQCELMNHKYRRNPAQFSVRPFHKMEFLNVYDLVNVIYDKVPHILKESYDEDVYPSIFNSDLNYGFTPVGTGLLGDINQRKTWFLLTREIPFYELHFLDFGLLLNLASSNLSEWTIDQVWYAGRTYNSLEELDAGYRANTIPKIKVERPTDTLFSSLRRRGKPVPEKPQRAPTPVEPEGKRYSVKQRLVEYLDWSFNFRMSSFTGPLLYDIRFRNETIAYEVSLGEISVFYSGSVPLPQVTNYVDSAEFVGLHSRALVPGGDCPDYATFVNLTFISSFQEELDLIDSAFCIFELNNGSPLRSHTSGDYGYEGMLDSSLTLRSALTIDNYDYIIDFIFHQNGVMETRFLSTGFILPSFLRESDRNYGFRLQEHIIGNVHHHLAQFKVDLDIQGTRNRLEALEFTSVESEDPKDSTKRHHKLGIRRQLKQSELEAVYDYDFNRPQYLLVHNDQFKTKNGDMRAYRVFAPSVSKHYLPENIGNERSVSWARHQMVVTKHKDDEFSSSSNYAMFDGADPVVDFSNFYKDNDTIVDEDLVLWITCGMHHIPHTEDLPVTPAVGNHLSFFLMPYNYFEDEPSSHSGDTIYQRNQEGSQETKKGGQCIIPPVTLEEDLQRNPDMVLETFRTGYAHG